MGLTWLTHKKDKSKFAKSTPIDPQSLPFFPVSVHSALVCGGKSAPNSYSAVGNPCSDDLCAEVKSGSCPKNLGPYCKCNPGFCRPKSNGLCANQTVQIDCPLNSFAAEGSECEDLCSTAKAEPCPDIFGPYCKCLDGFCRLTIGGQCEGKVNTF